MILVVLVVVFIGLVTFLLYEHSVKFAKHTENTERIATIIIDHVKRKSELASDSSDPATAARLVIEASAALATLERAYGGFDALVVHATDAGLDLKTIDATLHAQRIMINGGTTASVEK